MNKTTTIYNYVTVHDNKEVYIYNKKPTSRMSDVIENAKLSYEDIGLVIEGDLVHFEFFNNEIPLDTLPIEFIREYLKRNWLGICLLKIPPYTWFDTGKRTKTRYVIKDYVVIQ